jgi:hypothetical protein
MSLIFYSLSPSALRQPVSLPFENRLLIGITANEQGLPKWGVIDIRPPRLTEAKFINKS